MVAMHYFIFVDKALCNEFIARLNLRNYDIIYPSVVCFANLPKKTTTLQVNGVTQNLLHEFMQNDYVCNRNPKTVKIKQLNTMHTLIYVH